MDLKIKGKVAVVTASSRGLGKAAAEALAALSKMVQSGLAKVFAGSRGGFFKKSPWPPEASSWQKIEHNNFLLAWKL